MLGRCMHNQYLDPCKSVNRIISEARAIANGPQASQPSACQLASHAANQNFNVSQPYRGQERSAAEASACGYSTSDSAAVSVSFGNNKGAVPPRLLKSLGAVHVACFMARGSWRPRVFLDHDPCVMGVMKGNAETSIINCALGCVLGFLYVSY